MSKLLPNQVYAGLFEILKNQKYFYYSKVGINYCHLTDDGREEVLKWIETMAPHMYHSYQEEIDNHAKKLMWDELKK